MAKDSFAHIDDRELLQKFYSDGNNYWLGILLDRYTMLLLGVCMKYLKNTDEARDTVQQIFLKVITELAKYKVDYFKSWLYMIAKNQCLMRLRSSRQPLPLTDVAADTPVTHADQLEKEQAMVLIENSLQELVAEQKVCVTLFYLRQQSYQQVAEATGYSLLQVKSYIQNGKRNLKLIVEKNYNRQMADWKDILHDNESPISDKDLLSYIDQNTPVLRRQQIADTALTTFEQEALQGLQQLPDPATASLQAAILKKQLRQTLRSRKTKHRRAYITSQQWAIMATILLLIICIIGYVLIKKL